MFSQSHSLFLTLQRALDSKKSSNSEEESEEDTDESDEDSEEKPSKTPKKNVNLTPRFCVLIMFWLNDIA